MNDPTVVAALVAAARAGLPADVQELLVRGDPARGVPEDDCCGARLAVLALWIRRDE